MVTGVYYTRILGASVSKCVFSSRTTEWHLLNWLMHCLTMSTIVSPNLTTMFGQRGSTASAWLAYRWSVHTNNDVEGWHNRLNQHSQHGKFDVYQLVPLLHNEVQFVSVQAVLVPEHRLLWYQQRAKRCMQGRIATHWEQYTAGELTTSILLKKCACVRPR